MRFQQLWQFSLAAACGASLLLSGCSNQQQIDALQRSQAELRNEVLSLRKQIKAMEDIILALNRRIEEIRPEPGVQWNDWQATAQEPVQNTVQQKATNNLTRSEFTARVVGMNPERLAQFIGAPDKKTVKGGSEYWTYSTIPFKTSEAERGSIGIHIILDDQRVDRLVLINDVQYGQ